MTRVGIGLVAALFVAASLSGQSRNVASSCEQLLTLKAPAATITAAQLVPAGDFRPPAPRSSTASGNGDASDSTTTLSRLPAFCRVAATLTPSNDSDIGVELWLPIDSWNGKFQGVGNGAFNGTINYTSMATALRRGYATASTDTGHRGGGARWALGHPEKVTDFAWRAVHEMTVVSKRLVEAHYGQGARFSYWNGCSAGGRQGLKEAQRFPEDYDGIIAGAPAVDWTGRATQAVRIATALESNEGARLLAAERQLLHTAVIQACDAADGLKDGLIADPKRCTFDPAVLQCKSASQTGCLSAPRVQTARLLYSSAVNPSTGRETAGLARGSELGWTDMGWSASARSTGIDQFKFLVFGDASWTLPRFNLDTDIVRADAVDGGAINALDPDLKAFFGRGGKLLQYHGWSDPQISPENSTQYYARVLATTGASASRDSYRLFMAPGMAHCRGGEGPDTFDGVAALERWVEQGQTPQQIIASHSTNGTVDRTRPLCAYPQVAVYDGSGSSDEAANFICRVP